MMVIKSDRIPDKIHPMIAINFAASPPCTEPRIKPLDPRNPNIKETNITAIKGPRIPTPIPMDIDDTMLPMIRVSSKVLFLLKSVTFVQFLNLLQVESDHNTVCDIFSCSF